MLYILYLYVFFERKFVIQYVVEKSGLKEGGLLFLNKEIIDRCGAMIAKIFEIILETLESSNNSSVLVHCAVGKDRTGLIAALIQNLLEVPLGSIVEGYMKSNENLKSHHDAMIHEAEKMGMGQEFIECKPEIIEYSIDYLNEKYGGISEYLTLFSFDTEKQNRFKRSFMINNSPKN
ncbi:hypothetical protein HK096_004866 [Nowakowskiella sp. JEL0078]|nr:hypothetical protein HK096_004866 [Nowakowskiella sp. JEL0078]